MLIIVYNYVYRRIYNNNNNNNNNNMAKITFMELSNILSRISYKYTGVDKGIQVKYVEYGNLLGGGRISIKLRNGNTFLFECIGNYILKGVINKLHIIGEDYNLSLSDYTKLVYEICKLENKYELIKNQDNDKIELLEDIKLIDTNDLGNWILFRGYKFCIGYDVRDGIIEFLIQLNKLDFDKLVSVYNGIDLCKGVIENNDSTDDFLESLRIYTDFARGFFMKKN